MIPKTQPSPMRIAQNSQNTSLTENVLKNILNKDTSSIPLNHNTISQLLKESGYSCMVKQSTLNPNEIFISCQDCTYVVKVEPDSSKFTIGAASKRSFLYHTGRLVGGSNKRDGDWQSYLWSQNKSPAQKEKDDMMASLIVNNFNKYLEKSEERNAPSNSSSSGAGSSSGGYAPGGKKA